jgi:hypothetical protein
VIKILKLRILAPDASLRIDGLHQLLARENFSSSIESDNLENLPKDTFRNLN